MHQCWSKTSPLYFGSLLRDVQKRSWCQLLFELLRHQNDDATAELGSLYSEGSLPEPQGALGSVASCSHSASD